MDIHLILFIGNEDLIIVYVVILLFGVTGSSHKMLYSLYYVLYCTVLHCMVLYGTVRYGMVRYGTVLYCSVRYCTVLYGTVRYCTVLYGTVLYRTVSTVLYSGVSRGGALDA